jgi:SAM-dependent methyltransferase
VAPDSFDPVRYPLAWDSSYSSKGPQWRGGLQISKYLRCFDLSGTALEMGAGNGNTASQITRAMPPGSKLACIDVSRTALTLLPLGLRNDARVFSVEADARTLPFRAGIFKSIFARHVLTHAVPGDESRILSEVRRLLAEDGRALLDVFAPGDMRYGNGREIGSGVFIHGDGLVWRFFGEDELREAAKNANLAISEMETISRQVRFDGKEYSRESIVAVAARL